MHPRYICFLFIAPFLPATSNAQINARMLRYPDVSETQIAFIYAGDIWLAPKTGGTAHRLSSPLGEESFPRFSPDGQHIAFTGNYDGNNDLYRLPVQGGSITRLTHHPDTDCMIDWHPDGKSILFASRMQSGRRRYNQIYSISEMGGLPKKLSIPYGEFGVLSPDGKTLAYMPIDRSFSTWKRYRGGTAPDIWLFDLETYESQNISNSDANDSHPMWHNNTLYFLSDRGPNMRANIWAIDLDTNEMRQITEFSDFDVRFPAIGPSDIVFEAGGQLYLLILSREQFAPISIQVVTDLAARKPHVEHVKDLIRNTSVSPSGKRAAFEARGEIFSLPAEHGVVQNLTRTSGAAERYPTWSPDGKHIAYWTDRNGEYQLALRSANGSGEEQLVTEATPGYRPHWAPDSKKIAYIDNTMTLYIYNRDAKESTQVMQDRWLMHDNLTGFHINWSSGSRWLAYARYLPNSHKAIFIYDTQTNTEHQVTSGFYWDDSPVFDPDGKYLYLLTSRNLSPAYSDLQPTWIYANTTRIAAIALRNDVPSPLAPRNDVESKKEDKKDDDEKDDKKKKDDKKIVSVTIDTENFERRLILLPPKAGRYSNLQAVSGKVVYRRRPRTGDSQSKNPIVYYDLKEREEKTVLEDAGGFQLTANGKKRPRKTLLRGLWNSEI